MNNLSITSLIVTLFLLSILPNHTKSDDLSSPDYIHNVCHKTPYPELCNKTIRSDPRSSDNTIQTFAEIVFDAVEHNSKVGAAKIRKFYGGSGGTVKDALWKCSKIYIGMMKAAKEGIEKLREGNTEYAKGYAYIVMMESDRCERQFPYGQSPITSVNQHGQRLGADAAVIAQMMMM